MMPATGNKNIPICIKSVSIRLRPGGLSFFCEDAKGPFEQTVFFQDNDLSAHNVEKALNRFPQVNAGQISVYVDTPDVLFVPEQVLKTEKPDSLLQQAAIAIPAHHHIIVSDPENDICALFTLHEDIVRIFAAYGRGKAEIHWYSPVSELLTAYRSAGIRAESYALYPTQDNIYITKFDCNSQMSLCEVYPCKTEADVIYIMSELMWISDSAETKIYVYGDRPVRYTKVLKKYYPHTKTI